MKTTTKHDDYMTTIDPADWAAFTKTKALEQRILAKVEAYDYVTLAELDREIEGFSGEYSFANPNMIERNITHWGVSEEAFLALQGLLADKKVFMDATNWLTYMLDGATLELPIAKRVDHTYKKLHWLPVVLRPAKALTKKEFRSTFGLDRRLSPKAA